MVLTMTLTSITWSLLFLQYIFLAMATYTISINEKTKAGKKLAALPESLSEVVFTSVIRVSKGMDEELEDVKHVRTTEAENAKDLINKCLS